MARRLCTLEALRKLLGFTQKEFSTCLAISLETLKSLELGRRQLTREMADRIALKTGVSAKWLAANNGGRILHESGQPYSAAHFKQLDHGGVEGNPFWVRMERMEFAQVYYLLCRIADSYELNPHGRVTFKKRLESFMRDEEMRLPELHRELETARIKTDVLKVAPWLFPRNSGVFDLLSEDLRANRRAWELRQRALAEQKAKNRRRLTKQAERPSTKKALNRL
jgi:transcriptional regulator with XRE-family HTH domain